MAARLYNFFNALYSLETLDTRFVTSSTAPQKAALDPAEATGSERSKKPQPRHDAQPSKWRTTEYYVYYLVFIVIVPTMFKQVYDISQPGAPGYDEFSRRLSKGWIFGRKVDNSDGQYAHFRDNIFVMTGLLILHPLLRKVYGAFWRIDTYTNTKPVNGNSSGLSHGLSPSAAADARLQFRVSYDLIFGAVFLIALNGVSASKVFAILYLNYKIATQLPRSYVPAATWIFNVGVLFANELCKGYPFLGIMRLLLPKVQIAHDLGATLDRYGGLNPRWEVLFNISILRHISFNLDRYWAQARGASSPIEKQVDPALLSERDRVSYGASFNDFTLRNYLAYTLYAPLYLTGPIIGFNDYIAQSRYPLPSITSVRTFMYGVRFLVLLLTMEVVLHYIYVVSLIQTSPHWSQYNAYQLSMLGYFNLHIVWLKLLIPWRFFRLWALADGVDAPENMVRCMSDNYSTLSFWRSWHRSLNRWIVRYIYVPLGGSGTGKLRTLGNVAAVFTFIALWHDINLRLLAWGWLITLFVLPEVVAMVLFPKKKWAQYPETFRVLCGVGAVANVLMMMLANLVGFVTGLDGVRELIRGIVSGWSGMAFVAAACATLFVGVQVMFEHREAEKRHGIDLKC